MNYHSFYNNGFGFDVRIMEEILNQLDAIEEKGLCKGITRMTWDYGDTSKKYEHTFFHRISKSLGCNSLEKYSIIEYNP